MISSNGFKIRCLDFMTIYNMVFIIPANNQPTHTRILNHNCLCKFKLYPMMTSRQHYLNLKICCFVLLTEMHTTNTSAPIFKKVTEMRTHSNSAIIGCLNTGLTYLLYKYHASHGMRANKQHHTAVITRKQVF
jgi:hypothetical protein